MAQVREMEGNQFTVKLESEGEAKTLQSMIQKAHARENSAIAKVGNFGKEWVIKPAGSIAGWVGSKFAAPLLVIGGFAFHDQIMAVWSRLVG